MNGKEFIVCVEWKNDMPPTVSCFTTFEDAKSVLDVVPMAKRVTIHQHKNHTTQHVFTKEGDAVWMGTLR